MTLIESAKLNAIDAWAYLKDVLTKVLEGVTKTDAINWHGQCSAATLAV